MADKNGCLAPIGQQIEIPAKLQGQLDKRAQIDTFMFDK